MGPWHDATINGSVVLIQSATWTVYDDDDHLTVTADGYTEDGTNWVLLNPVTVNQYDADGRALSVAQVTRTWTNGPLVTSDLAYLVWGNYTAYTSYQYNSAEQLETTIVATSIVSNAPGYYSGMETTYGYDWAGRVNREVDPNGDITDYTYDFLGNLIEVQQGTNDTDNSNMVETAAYTYDADGDVTQQTLFVDNSTSRPQTTTMMAATGCSMRLSRTIGPTRSTPTITRTR